MFHFVQVIHIGDKWLFWDCEPGDGSSNFWDLGWFNYGKWEFDSEEEVNAFLKDNYEYAEIKCWPTKKS